MIIITDLHDGKTSDSFPIDSVPSQKVDLYRRLASILARAKLTRQSIAVGGDAFNRVNPSSQVFAMFFGWLNRCKTAGIDVVLIGGNHDSGVDWTNMLMFQEADLSNVTVVTKPSEVVVTDGKGDSKASRITLFWPHMPAYDREKAEQGHGSISRYVASLYPKTEFVITHGTLVGGESYTNDIFFEAGDAMLIDVKEFRKLKLMVLGHIHKHIEGVVKKTGKEHKSSAKWIYPGSVTINNFGEVDESKGWVEVDLLTLEYKWHEFPDDVTPWVHVELDLTEKDESTLDEDAIEELVSGAVVKITVFAKAHGVINEVHVKQLFNKYGFVSRFETVITNTDEIGDNPETKKISRKDLLSRFLDETDATEDEKALALKMGLKFIEEVTA